MDGQLMATPCYLSTPPIVTSYWCVKAVSCGTHMSLCVPHEPKLRSRVLESLHEGHLGVVKMKSLARGSGGLA